MAIQLISKDSALTLRGKMTFEEKLEYCIMLLMCLSVIFGLYWMTLELKHWGVPVNETQYIDTGYTCIDKVGN